MPGLLISDIDQTTITRLRNRASEHGHTLEDEVRDILQHVAAEAEIVSNDREKKPLSGSEASLSRGAASLQPMTLSEEDAASMKEAWEKGLAQPKLPIAPLPEYRG